MRAVACKCWRGVEGMCIVCQLEYVLWCEWDSTVAASIVASGKTTTGNEIRSYSCLPPLLFVLDCPVSVCVLSCRESWE